jgi:hypothetical protein
MICLVSHCLRFVFLYSCGDSPIVCLDVCKSLIPHLRLYGRFQACSAAASFRLVLPANNRNCLVLRCWSSCRGSKYVEDRYTGARFQPECAGQVSPLGDIVQIGADASGLLISPTQVR